MNFITCMMKYIFIIYLFNNPLDVITLLNKLG